MDWEMLFHIMIAMNLMPGSLFLLREAFEAFDGFDGLLYGDLVRAALDFYNWKCKSVPHSAGFLIRNTILVLFSTSLLV